MNIRYQYNYITSLLKRYGFRGLVLKTLERRQSPMLSYTGRYRQYMPTAEELDWQREHPLSFQPLVSIVVPAYETPKQYLRELIDSILVQSYPNWELCLADGSRTDAVERVTAEYREKDARIRYQRLSKNGGISENTNGGFAMAKGTYIALMDHDDLLTANALYEMVRSLGEDCPIEQRPLAMIYSDEDKINSDGTVHSRPHFKPDFNLEFLRHNNYFCHFLLFSRELLAKAGGLNKEYDGAQDYDFVLRCVDAGAQVFHVPKILYHWRIHEGSTAGNSADKSYAFDNGCRAIEAHLNRCGEPGHAEVTSGLGVYRVAYRLQGTYEITVAAEEENQLERIRAYYEAQPYDTKPYRLKIAYRSVDSPVGIETTCSGEYIVYIRKNIVVQPGALLETLLGICQHKHTAIAGAKLLTPKRRVASCGLLYDSRGNLIPSCGGLRAEYKGYFLHAVIPQNVSALEFGCVMFRRKALIKAGGMDKSLKGIYRDADICFRLTEIGYGIVVTPEVTAVQMDLWEEQDTREAFFRKWRKALPEPDPCYNSNLSLKAGHTYEMRQE